MFSLILAKRVVSGVRELPTSLRGGPSPDGVSKHRCGTVGQRATGKPGQNAFSSKRGWHERRILLWPVPLAVSTTRFLDENELPESTGRVILCGSEPTTRFSVSSHEGEREARQLRRSLAERSRTRYTFDVLGSRKGKKRPGWWQQKNNRIEEKSRDGWQTAGVELAKVDRNRQETGQFETLTRIQYRTAMRKEEEEF